MTHAHSLSLSHTHVHVHSHSAPLFLSVVFFFSDLLDFKHLLFQLFVRNSTSVRTSVDTIHHVAPYPYIHCKYNTHTSDHLITLYIIMLLWWALKPCLNGVLYYIKYVCVKVTTTVVNVTVWQRADRLANSPDSTNNIAGLSSRPLLSQKICHFKWEREKKNTPDHIFYQGLENRWGVNKTGRPDQVLLSTGGGFTPFSTHPSSLILTSQISFTLKKWSESMKRWRKPWNNALLVLLV